MIKESGQNITIATFSDFVFYKQEGYEANLYAGKILEEHGIPVAYKSDHVEEGTNAKYLLFEAQNAHQFGLSEKKALQAVTSVPAKSLRLDHRIGYTKAGYDADLVIWSSHPLSVGATPLQVFVDGRETLDGKLSKENANAGVDSTQHTNEQARIRMLHDGAAVHETCQKVLDSSSVVITGIQKSYFHNDTVQSQRMKNLTLILNNGVITCFDTSDKCATTDKDASQIHLENGHALPGFIAVATGLGLEEIAAEKSTTDGKVPPGLDTSDPSQLIYARYGIHLEGKAFGRARIGGVTRAVSIPHVDEGGFGGAVSVGIKTSERNTTLDGGIFKDEVGLHLVVGQAAKKSTETVSASIAKLRKLLAHNKGEDNIYGLAVKGDIPLVIHTESKVSELLSFMNFN
jgi:imidazolonepropionase-like amidohydrolase